MAIRYDTVDDGGAFVKVCLDEPDDVITFAREACADPKKWNLFESPMLQRLLIIFQERLDEAEASRRYDVTVAAEERGRRMGRAEEAGRRESQEDRSILVGAQLKDDLKKLAQGQRGGVKSVLRRLITGPPGDTSRRQVAALKKILRVEVERHEAGARRLRRAVQRA